jgi:hypothetical protein
MNVMEKVKIIFLDIDGVLNSELWYRKRYLDRKNGFTKSTKRENYREHELTEFDDDCVALLSSIVVETEAKIVISSTWRGSHSIEELQSLLDEKGFCGEIIGVTPKYSYTDEDGHYQSVPRGQEILGWIKKNKEIIEDYVILDDDSDMLYNQRSHFFYVDRYCGITSNLAYKIIRRLNKVFY